MASPRNTTDRSETSREQEGSSGTPSPGVIGGAALVGAGVGALLSGPLLAVGLGVGAAGLCLRKDQAGDVARSTGRAGLAAVDKTKELNQQYGVTKKIKGAAKTTYARAKEVDEEHKVVDKAKVGAAQAWGRLKEVDREHRLVARAGEALGGVMDEVADAAAKKDDRAGARPSKKDRKPAKAT